MKQAGVPMGERLDSLELRVTAIEEGMQVIRLEMKHAASELQENTFLTEEIHGNTQTIIEAVKATAALWNFATRWGKRLAVFMKYVGYVAGGFAAVWAFLKVWK